MRRRVAILGSFLLLATGTPSDAAITFSVTAQVVQRGALLCAPLQAYCTPIFKLPEGMTQGSQLEGKHVCVGTSLASTAPTYECRVTVGATLTGTAPRNAPVALTFAITSNDGSPWGDDVRRQLRATPQAMQPLASGAPTVCSLLPAHPTISCARTGPRTWTLRASTSTATGLYYVPMKMQFPASTGTEPVCEYLRIKATSKIGPTTKTVDLGRRRYCT